MIKLFKYAVVAIVTLSIGAIAAVLVTGKFDLLAAKVIDRSGPTLLERIRTLQEFNAAEGNFVQDIDIESDTPYLPSFLSGERVVALVKGSVDATVDFASLNEDSLNVDKGANSIQITLPKPVLGEVELDEKSVRIFRSRGFADRVEDFFASNPTDDSPIYKAAEEKIGQAATESDLLARARTNTEQWLRTFLTAAGFQTVDVSWQP